MLMDVLVNDIVPEVFLVFLDRHAVGVSRGVAGFCRDPLLLGGRLLVCRRPVGHGVLLLNAGQHVAIAVEAGCLLKDALKAHRVSLISL